jgi:uncharacterized protein YukE
MWLLPDPAALDALAERINGHAGAARSRALQLTGAVATTTWSGTAADAFRTEAHVVAAALRGAAGRLDDAADALRSHAHAVRRLLADLSAAGRAGAQTLDDLVHDPARVPGDLAGLAGDGVHLIGDALSVVGL